MKNVLVMAWQRLKELDVRIVGFMHDEFSMECREDQANQVASICEQCFIDAGKALQLNVPTIGEAKIGDNWYQVH